MSDTSATDGRTFAGSAFLCIASKWNSAENGLAHPDEKLPVNSGFTETWTVFEIHDDEARTFVELNKKLRTWALLAYVSSGHVKATRRRTFTQVYNEDYLLPALRKVQELEIVKEFGLS